MSAHTLSSRPLKSGPGIPVDADPKRDIWLGSVIATLFFVLFLGWSAFARLDAAAYAQGHLVVIGQRQSVQHKEGGLVRKIYVKEGGRVERGQLVVQLAAAEVQAQERSLAAQSIRLLAQRARLEAEQLGLANVPEPRDFLNFSPEDRREAAVAMQLQQVELSTRRAVLAAQRGAIDQRGVQSSQQGHGFDEQAIAVREQLRLIDEQISALRPVAEKGFVSQTRLRELERARAELRGASGQYSASVAQTHSAVRESRLQVVEAERSFHERSASDLREVETRLGELMPRWRAAQDQLDRTAIRAPTTGTVVGLSVFTPGGVIAPGQKLMEIVPENAPLLIQGRISPDEADDLRNGQKTLVRFSGLHERTLPSLIGEITRISADSLIDDKSGQSYFTCDIAVPYSQIKIIKQFRGSDFDLRPGMPVVVLIPLRRRTALDYALEPLLGSLWAAFREH